MNRLRTTIYGFNQQAEAYQARFMDLDLYNPTYDRFCELVPQPGARLLEIGCGPGNITRYLLLKRPDFRILAIDLAPDMIRLARANNPGAQFQVMDARAIRQLPERYAGLMCGFCLPYLSGAACARLLADAAELLEPGGIFYFSTIAGEYRSSGYQASSNGQYKAYVYYHSEAFLQKQLAAHQLELLHLERIPFMKAGGNTETHLVFLVRKK